MKAVIADCGYTSPWEIVCDVAKKTYHLPKFPVMHIFRLAVRIDAGFDLCSVSAEKAAANTDIPIFFAHGTGDKFVPYEMSVRNQRAHAAESYLFSVENAGHGLSFMIDRENYSRECMNFLGKVFVIRIFWLTGYFRRFFCLITVFEDAFLCLILFMFLPLRNYILN